MRILILSLLFSAVLPAQETVAPTPDRTGPARGENHEGYNIVQSFETGYRFHTVGGDLGKYRSDVNYGNGIRLLSSYLTIHSRDGQGRWFDELILTTQGLGNDPYQSATLRVHKNTLYDYNLVWRENDYYNPALTIANGQHFRDLDNRWQDHQLTLFPQTRFHVLAGFSHTSESGSGLSTTNILDTTGDEFLLSNPVRRQWNEYRIGADVSLFGARLSVVRSWEFFKEENNQTLTGPGSGANSTDTTSLQSFNRGEPYHGRAPGWRIGLFGGHRKWLAYNGRYSFTNGLRNFAQNEFAQGLARFSSIDRQVFIGGDAQRPVTTANLNLTVSPTDRLSITNHSAFYRIRMDGQNTYQEINNQTLDSTLLSFQYLGIRTFSNTTDLDYRISPTVSVSAGYHVATRQFRSIEQVAQPDFSNRDAFGQNNILHAGRTNVRWRPLKPLTVVFEGEIGRTNRPFYPTSDKDYHSLGARAQYRTRTLSLTAAFRSYSNFNAAPDTSSSLRNKTYSADAAWTPKPWLSFDLSYSRLHLNTVSGLAYFANSSLITGESSLYISNLHFGYANVRFSLKKKADLYLGYSRTQDTGDGRGTPFGSQPNSALPALQLAQTFPLTFESPLARFSVPIRPKIRFNLGYQYYRYREEFAAVQNYRAHTGYTSLTWSF